MVNTTTEERIRRTIKKVVEMLVIGDYKGLENLTNGLRLRGEHIEAGVAGYGRTLTYPPVGAYNNIDVVEVAGCLPAQYAVRFRLFTVEEGQSDLEVQATLVDEYKDDCEMRIEIDNILVA